jgi:hypothetical protein
MLRNRRTGKPPGQAGDRSAKIRFGDRLQSHGQETVFFSGLQPFLPPCFDLGKIKTATAVIAFFTFFGKNSSTSGTNFHKNAHRFTS